MNDAVWTTQGKRISVNSIDADFSGSSAQEQTIDIVHAHRLMPTSFDEKSYKTYIKGYLKAVKSKLQETNPERVEAYERGAAALVKKVLANFEDYTFYTGQSMEPEGMVVLASSPSDEPRSSPTSATD
ncbi:translationally-controlled tumor protein [Streptomyces virginiae]|uniref:translationally-controlled tumor protein n=1 Tax=Streptomyces virginiae TaxID=1961 RepID=UPI0022527F27|nr:translationally-controlled tumor protein [Streptomyces virginiae]MCX5174077.1 translationally-controlled tumor protein [Streptomyces virginiae]